MTLSFTPSPEILFTPHVEPLSYPITADNADIWIERIEEVAEDFYQGLTHQERIDYINMDEDDLIHDLRLDIWDGVEPQIHNPEVGNYDLGALPVEISTLSSCAEFIKERLHDYVVDRASQIAEGMKDLFDQNPDAALEGCTRALEMSEEYLMQLNVDPDFSNSELIYWETFRDYFLTEVGRYSFDY